ncbi:MAG: PHP domain-containing protein [Blautia sp.]|nr:PHP domain-containing protein [Blautia sp.]
MNHQVLLQLKVYQLGLCERFLTSAIGEKGKQNAQVILRKILMGRGHIVLNTGDFEKRALTNRADDDSQPIDLHLHTTNSDGEEPPEMVVKAAKDAGLSLIAITDHNLFTYTEPREYMEMSIVPGIELSAGYYVPAWNETTEVHVVGIFPYGVNAADFEWLLSDIEKGKEDYVSAILQGLSTRGIHISMQEVMSVERTHERIGRHEIAKILVSRGIESSIDAAFDHQIGNFSPFYIPSTRYIHYASLDDIVRQILESGGIPVLAHPFGYSMNEPEIEQLIKDFTIAAERSGDKRMKSSEAPAAGIEVFYQMYLDSSESSRLDFLKRMQEKYNLLASAGSDRHRPDQPFCTAGDRGLFRKMLQRLRR